MKAIAACAAFFLALPTQTLAAELEVQRPETGIVLASGEATSPNRQITSSVPTRTRSAWLRFVKNQGASWRGYFDAETGVPGRIWGAGISAPGATHSADVAEEHARDVLESHGDLLAPGSKADDLELVTNAFDGKMRVLGFVQRHAGIPVLGGRVNFRYKNDQLIVIGSEALPNVTATLARDLVSDDRAGVEAEKWVSEELRTSAHVEGASGHLMLPLRSEAGLEFHHVVDVRVRTTNPTGRYAVYVDAATAAPIARRQLLMFGSGTISFNVPDRWPGATRSDRKAVGLSVSVDGRASRTDDLGAVTWTATAASVSIAPEGPRVSIVNQGGVATSTTAVLEDGDSFVWNQSRAELSDAQLIAYVASQDVKSYLAKVAPTFGWVDQTLSVNVNIDSYCNAYSDGMTTNFFRAGMGCENTARLPDVVVHESGHVVHFNAILDGVGNFDSSLSEGVSDYLAATMVADAQMGRGFFLTDAPLRDLDPAGKENQWPDDISRDPHETGLIIGGALWDLRKRFVEVMGPEAGVEAADRIWFSILQRAADVPSTYAEAIATDDDDGDLSNGTPHLCLINGAFSPHGLVDKVNAGPGIGAPSYDDLTLTVSFPFLAFDTCPGSNITSAQVVWELPADPNQHGSIDMTLAAEGGRYSGVLPRANGNVVSYRVEVTFDDGSHLAFPDNPADPNYQVFVGEVIPLYCSNFDTDTSTAGWTHRIEASASSMPVDDWQWGPPMSFPASGDPTTAYSGGNVMGNDLGQGSRGDGRYVSNTTSALLSPPVDVAGYGNVHLQYRRWLTVEDGLNDQARIFSNDTLLWQNLATPRADDPLYQVLVNHIDREWRFQDLDLTPTVVDGKVRLRFQLTSNRRRSYGGWTIDSFCVVALPVCGNGATEPGETCDDGNTNDGDGCTTTCQLGSSTPVCSNAIVEAGEECDDGVNDGTACTDACSLPVVTPSCGNGATEANEACDDGVNDGTTCNPDCQLPVPRMIESEDQSCGCNTTNRSPIPTWGWFLLLGLTRLRRPGRLTFSAEP